MYRIASVGDIAFSEVTDFAGQLRAAVMDHDRCRTCEYMIRTHVGNGEIVHLLVARVIMNCHHRRAVLAMRAQGIPTALVDCGAVRRCTTSSADRWNLARTKAALPQWPSPGLSRWVRCTFRSGQIVRNARSYPQP